MSSGLVQNPNTAFLSGIQWAWHRQASWPVQEMRLKPSGGPKISFSLSIPLLLKSVKGIGMQQKQRLIPTGAPLLSFRKHIQSPDLQLVGSGLQFFEVFCLDLSSEQGHEKQAALLLSRDGPSFTHTFSALAPFRTSCPLNPAIGRQLP